MTTPCLPQPRMTEFIAEHHVLTLATQWDGTPWCAHAFYAYLPEVNRFLIASAPDTRHMQELLGDEARRVAWAIALETKVVGKIRGLQCTGFLRDLDEKARVRARAAYLRRFPVARMMPRLHLWALDPDSMKLTDNRLGFGAKLLWTAAEGGS